MPAERITCIDHDIVDCPDCGQWFDEMDARDDRHAAEVSALRAELRIARSDIVRARSEAERETVQRIVERLRERFAQGRLRKVSTDPFRLGFDRAWEAFGVVIDHIELEFGCEDKGGEPRQ